MSETLAMDCDELVELVTDYLEDALPPHLRQLERGSRQAPQRRQQAGPRRGRRRYAGRICRSGRTF